MLDQLCNRLAGGVWQAPIGDGCNLLPFDPRLMRFAVGCNPRQHRDGLLRVLPHRRFGRQHDAVGTVQDGVGNVRGLRASRQAARSHRLQHLRRRDHRLTDKAGAGDELLLQDGHLLDRHFHAEVAARNHDSVAGLENLVKALQRVCPFYLRDNERLFAHVRGGRANRFDVGRGLHERLAHRVHALTEREFKAGAVVFSERTNA